VTTSVARLTRSLRATRPRLLALATATVFAATLVATAAAAAPDRGDGQAAGPVIGAHGAPDQCLLWQQLNADEQRYRTTDNAPFVYDDSVYGSNWFDVRCGHLTFSVPFGRQALVDLTAVAELDCRVKEPKSQVDGEWCGGRFLINNLPLPHPDNTGRSDTYAWDTAKGGFYDYQAHTLAQEYHAICENPTGGTAGQPCYYRVQLQSRLEAGATSIWIDDLTMRVDVSIGPVTVT
jgi:hypothetical protein